MVLEDLSFDLNYGACYSQMQCADTRKHFELGSWNWWKLFFVQCSKILGKWTSGSKAIQICRSWLVLLKCILSHLWLFIGLWLPMTNIKQLNTLLSCYCAFTIHLFKIWAWTCCQDVREAFFFSLTILGQKQLHYWIIFCSMMFNGAIFSKWWGEWGNRAAHRHNVQSMTKAWPLDKEWVVVY